MFRDCPPVLIINALSEQNYDASIWSTPGFLPERLGTFIHPDGRVTVVEENLEQLGDNIQTYELIGFVAHIRSAQDQKSHLVSLING